MLDKRLKEMEAKSSGRKVSKSRRWGYNRQGGMGGIDFTYDPEVVKRSLRERLKGAEKGRRETEIMFLEENNGGLTGFGNKFNSS